MIDSTGSILPRTARPMKIGVFLPVAETMLDGAIARWTDLLAIVRQAEDVGFDSIWVPDHMLFEAPNGYYGSWECWSLLAGLAAVTNRLTLGPFVSCTGFRNPALLAKMADTLDEISNGRLVLGLGSGWNRVEHAGFGYPFDHRVSRFAEALTIIHGLLREGRSDFHGKYYHTENCELVPRGPQAHRLPIMVGGRGERMLQLTARYADMWNSDWALPTDLPPLLAAVDSACALVGRDPMTLERTAAVRIEFPGVTRYPMDSYRGQASGTTEDLAALLRAFANQGISHLQVWFIPNIPRSIEAFAPVLDLFDHG